MGVILAKKPCVASFLSSLFSSAWIASRVALRGNLACGTARRAHARLLDRARTRELLYRLHIISGTAWLCILYGVAGHTYGRERCCLDAIYCSHMLVWAVQAHKGVESDIYNICYYLVTTWLLHSKPGTRQACHDTDV